MDGNTVVTIDIGSHDLYRCSLTSGRGNSDDVSLASARTGLSDLGIAADGDAPRVQPHWD